MRSLFFLLCLLSGLSLPGQVCNGSLGDNIFEAGDFGSGSSNIRLPNPQIAPDYMYTSTNPPPEDGSYVLTNNTGGWPRLFPSWLAIGDNSDDPNGYMMVVNASFAPGLFYDQEVTGLCENTLYEFSADIINLIRPGIGGHIDPNVTFLINGEVEFTTGNVPKSGEWENYGFTFTTGPGQTSVRLSLRNNAPGGIGNDLALDNISFRACGDDAFILPQETAIICEDGSPLPLYATISGVLYPNPAMQWQRSPDGINDWEDIPGANDTVYVHTELRLGFYYYRFQLANGQNNLDNVKCRINSNVKVVHVRPEEYELRATICSGMSYEVGNSSYTASGNYVDSLINIYGCDSIVELDLTVLPDPDIQADFQLEVGDCFNTTDGQVQISNVSNGTSPYRYQIGEQPPSNQTLYTNLLGDTTYRFRIIDANGCSLDTLLFFPTPPSLLLDLGPDRELLLGEPLRIAAQTNFTPTSYRWSSSVSTEVLPCTVSSDCAVIDWYPLASQYVYLTTEDELGCSVTDSVYISVEPVREVYIPNIFSPNRDGLNDRFTAFGPSPRLTSLVRLQVFDRWGKLIFEGRDLTPGALREGWDGTVKGKEAPAGVYVYLIEVRYLDGVVQTFSGDVALLR